MSKLLLSVQSTQKIALGIEYDGSRYYGWQQQQKLKSVQACLEQALSKVANVPINVLCAGRTDAGVHATGQVVHFVTSVHRNDTAWSVGVNSYLPPDIAVHWVSAVAEDFHSRFSATARRYRYIIYNHRNRAAVLPHGIAHFPRPLNAFRMHRAAQVLLGYNDFTSFRSAKCQSETSWRNVKHVKIIRQGAYIIVDIKANAFLHHMVRNIVGSLLEVGCGHRDERWLAELLALKNRDMAGSTAKAAGLYLVSVDYPAHFALPQFPLGPLFLLMD